MAAGHKLKSQHKDIFLANQLSINPFCLFVWSPDGCLNGFRKEDGKTGERKMVDKTIEFMLSVFICRRCGVFNDRFKLIISGLSQLVLDGV